MEGLDYKKYKILLVDDELHNLTNLIFAFALDYTLITASSGIEALDIINKDRVAVVVTDQKMGGMSGVELLDSIKKTSPKIVRILITAYSNLGDAIEAVNTGDIYRYIKKDIPMNEIETIIKQAIEKYHIDERLEETQISLAKEAAKNKQLYEELNNSVVQTITALAKTLDARDRYTYGHSERVAEYSVGIAEILGFSEEQKVLIKMGGLLHDIGKIGVSDEVLRKPSKLTNEEYNEIKRHPTEGAKILEPIPQLQNIIDIVLHHHERCDGRGYPDGLKNEAISQEAQVIGVADCFDNIASWIVGTADAYDAMTSPRAYRGARSHEAAIEELLRCKGTQFDPQVVDAFCEYYQKNKERFKPFKSPINYKDYTILCIGEETAAMKKLKVDLRDEFTVEFVNNIDEALNILENGTKVLLTLIFQEVSEVINQEMVDKIIEDRFPVTKVVFNSAVDIKNYTQFINKFQVVKYLVNPQETQPLKMEIMKNIEDILAKDLQRI
ncbi:MAG: HD domain-containing phosphohydrolase [bacterium]